MVRGFVRCTTLCGGIIKFRTFRARKLPLVECAGRAHHQSVIVTARRANAAKAPRPAAAGACAW